MGGGENVAVTLRTLTTLAVTNTHTHTHLVGEKHGPCGVLCNRSFVFLSHPFEKEDEAIYRAAW